MSDRITVPAAIKELLKIKGRMWKGSIEDELRTTHGSYGDTTARRLRELAESGEIEKGEEAGRTWYQLPNHLAIPQHVGQSAPTIGSNAGSSEA